MNLIEDDAILRILRWVAINIQQQVDNFKPQELSNSVWAFSTIGFGYDESSGLNQHNDYTYVISDAPTQDKKLVFDTLEIIAESALPRLQKFKVSIICTQNIGVIKVHFSLILILRIVGSRIE